MWCGPFASVFAELERVTGVIETYEVMTSWNCQFLEALTPKVVSESKEKDQASSNTVLVSRDLSALV